MRTSRAAWSRASNSCSCADNTQIEYSAAFRDGGGLQQGLRIAIVRRDHERTFHRVASSVASPRGR